VIKFILLVMFCSDQQGLGASIFSIKYYYVIIGCLYDSMASLLYFSNTDMVDNVSPIYEQSNLDLKIARGRYSLSWDPESQQVQVGNDA
jgi:hypothetical protein